MMPHPVPGLPEAADGSLLAAVSQLSVRPAAVAGTFYPANRAALIAQLEAMLAAAADQHNHPAPKAIIVPHAGYNYSGETAARAYARIGQLRGTIRRVVLLGPAHRVHLRGLALPEVEAFDTPMGTVQLDLDAMRQVSALRQVVASRPVHAAEHALEVQLPFLLHALGEFKLVPLVVGEATPAMVAEVLDLLWGGDETLIVISSDLSHFHSYRDAMNLDARTVAAILAQSQYITHEQACGATPINGLMQLAKRRGLAVELIDQSNSGDTAGDRSRVVGYAAFALYQEKTAETIVPQWFPAGGGVVLLSLARASIERALGLTPAYSMHAPWLEHQAAVFVTLSTADDIADGASDGALRGCIGSLEAHRTLAEDIAENAAAAAMRDPRFDPVRVEELDALRIEISLLGKPELMVFGSQDEALAQLKPRRDGVIFAAAGRRATFLPQVWDQIPAPREFLAQLKLKAGLSRDYWSADIKLWRYGVVKFSGCG